MNVELKLEDLALVIEALDFTTEDGLNPDWDDKRLLLSTRLKYMVEREFRVSIPINPFVPGFRIRDLAI